MLRGMRSSRVAALCAVAALLLFAIVSARGKSAVPGSLREVPLERGLGYQGIRRRDAWTRTCSRSTSPTSSGSSNTLFIIIAMMLLLVAFAMFIRRLQRRRRRPIRLGVGLEDIDEEIGALEISTPMRLRRAAQRARDELAGRSGGLLGDAIVAAWLRLEEAAAHEGAGRKPHETATESTTALLARYTTSEPALDELRELYQRARFGPPGLGDADADAALAALDRILHALANAATPAVAETWELT